MAKPLDTTKPNIARMYDYWLGGKDNFEADRKAAEAVREQRPDVAVQALDNKKFLTRAVTYIAGQGVTQFLDIGSGLPTSPARTGIRAPWLSTHEAAEAVVADPVVAYIDYDPVAVLHSQALLTGGSDRVVAVAGDMHDSAAIFADGEIRAAGFDPNVPACVILACVLHFVDGSTARSIVRSITAALAPGSYLVMSLGFAKGHGGEDFVRAYNAQGGARIYAQTWDMITALFDDLELVPPGIVDSATWRAGWQETGHPDRPSIIAGGVGRRP